MARTALTPVSLPRNQGVTVSANAADYAYVAGDLPNGNSVPWTGKEILLVNNVNAGAQTLTVDASPDAFDRDGSITDYEVGIGEFARFFLGGAHWKQSDGNIHINVGHADVKLAVLKVNALP